MKYKVIIIVEWKGDTKSLKRELEIRIPYGEVINMEPKVAQTNLKCAKCPNIIKAGHKYIPVLIPVGHDFRWAKIHPECYE